MAHIGTHETLHQEAYAEGISWGGVIGGWLVALTATMLMYALGSGIGISALNFTNAELLSTKTLIFSGVWVLVTWMVALYLGGLFSSRAAHYADRRTGGLNGI